MQCNSQQSVVKIIYFCYRFDEGGEVRMSVLGDMNVATIVIEEV